MHLFSTLIIPLLMLFVPSYALAQDMNEVSFNLNTLYLLICAILVMFMAAGFAMLEAGMVRSRSVATIVLKNISLYSAACIMFFLVGYNVMYDGVDQYIGSFGLWFSDDTETLSGNISSDFSSSADFFFQVVFVATAASIVSGTMAERVRIEPFLIFVLVLAGLIYPIAGAWKWGGGWLDQMGFQDFAGSTLVHSVGGWAALTGAILLGARAGRFDEKGNPVHLQPSAITLVGLGTFVLWLGWFGFNGGSQLAFNTKEDTVAVANIMLNTNMAAAGGVIAALLLSHLRYGRIDVYQTLNGALAGLVTITAEPLAPSIGQALVIGAAGGALLVFTEPLLLKLKIDDVVGAIPVHLFCGILGTLLVPITNPDADFGTQLIGVAAIGGFAAGASLITWSVVNMLVKLRLSDEAQEAGADSSELGVHAYPYFEEKRFLERL